MTRLSTASLPAVLATALIGGLSAPSVAQGCEPVDLCVHWSVTLQDGGTGDHLTEATVPARGNRVTIIRPAPEPPLGLFLDNEGCAQFETQFAAGHKIIVYNEAVYDSYTHIRAFASEDEIEEGTTHVWPVHVGIIGDNDDINAVIDADEENLQNLMGVSVETLHRLNLQPGGLPQLARNLFPFKDDGSNASADYEALRIGADSQQEKFVIAHEIGHWLVIEAEWAEEAGWSSSYAYTPQDSPCAPVTAGPDPDLGGHSLRSAEHASGAMTEGFAHFVATAAFNAPADTLPIGWFRYYKELIETPSPEGYLVATPDGPVGGVNQWVQTQCPTDFNAGQEISSEIDWLRFFWDYITAPSDQPSFWDVVELYKYTNEEHPWTAQGPVFPLMLTAIQELAPAADAVRFEELEPSHGLIND